MVGVMSDTDIPCPKCEAINWSDNGLGERIVCKSCGWMPMKVLRQKIKEDRGDD